MIRLFSAAALALSLAYAGPLAQAAETGVTDSTITFGQAAALDGPAKALGTGMKAGLEAAFAEVNAAGGVNGRQLKLISRDDGYNPQKSIEQTKALISEDKVFAIIGPVGTPTAKATVPVVGEAGLPYIGPLPVPVSCAMLLNCPTFTTSAPPTAKKWKPRPPTSWISWVLPRLLVFIKMTASAKLASAA